MHKSLCMLVCLFLVGCTVDPCKQAGGARLTELRADSLFRKRVECGHFLEKIAGSAAGPDLPKFKKGDPLTFNPLVFYNSTLNTCVLIAASASTGPNDKHTFFDVSDLLTGKSLEMKNIDTSTPAGVQEANQYSDELAEKYEK